MGIYDGTETVDWDTKQRDLPPTLPSGWRWSQRSMICPNPNCGYRGAAAARPRGSRAAMWVLMLLLVVPGLIYGMFFSGQRFCCPKCRTVVDLA